MINIVDYIKSALTPKSRLTLEKIGRMQHQAAWSDIMAKAKRLIQSGNIQIRSNTPTHVSAHVVGDNGEYNCEISRHDPTSQVIEQWSCFLANAPVTMADGTRKDIADIRMGDKVITHLGNIKTVTATMSRPYDGTLTRVKINGVAEEVVATDNHRMWSANNDYHHSRRNGWEGKYKSRHHQNQRGLANVNYELTESRKTGCAAIPLEPTYGWVEMRDLEVHDYLSLPESYVAQGNPVVLTEGTLGHKSNMQSMAVEADVDLAYVLGWYAAEGHVVKSDNNRIALTLHKNELPYIERIQDILEEKFGSRGTIRYPKGTNVIDYRISHFAFRQACEQLIGSMSYDKCLSQSLIDAPLPVIESFIRGWHQGDRTTESNGRDSIVTVSERLAHQLRIMLARLGYATELSWRDDNYGNGFVKNCRRIYKVRWKPEVKIKNAKRFMRDGFAWMRIESISHEHYEGLVYDIEVEDDHSFIAFGVGVHNCECPWSQYAWNRTRKWKKFEGRVCSHVLGTYWRAKSTPLDTEGVEDYQPDRGQRVRPMSEEEEFEHNQGRLPLMSEEDADVGNLPRTFSPDDEAPTIDDLAERRQQEQERRERMFQQRQPQQPTMKDLAIPQQPQIELFDQAKPQQPKKRKNVDLWDLGTDMPSPFEQMQLPFYKQTSIPIISIRTSKFVFSDSDFESWVLKAIQNGQTPKVQLRQEVMLELRGGKIPMPGTVPVDVNEEGISVYNVTDLGYDPKTDQRVRSDGGQMAPEQRGTYATAKAGKRAEIVDIEPFMKQIYISVPLHKSGPYHPHLLSGWVDYNDVIPLPDAGDPFRQKR